MKKFESGEDKVETSRAFISSELSNMSLDELRQELDQLRKDRTPKVQKAQARRKKEKEAKEILQLEKLVPDGPNKEAIQKKIRSMTGDERRQLLLALAKQSKT